MVGSWKFISFRQTPHMNDTRSIRMLLLCWLPLLWLVAGTGCDRDAQVSTAHATNIVLLSERNFQTEVIASAQPVLVDFWAPWCGPCRLIAPVLNELAVDFEGRAKIAKVNVDESSPLAQRFGIQAIPTLLIFSHGRVIDQVTGVVPKKDLAAKLEKVIVETKRSGAGNSVPTTVDQRQAP